MPIQLRKALKSAGATSARDLFKKTRSPEKSLYRQGQIAAIDELYRETGGVRGPVSS